jgi:hypothetical protein
MVIGLFFGAPCHCYYAQDCSSLLQLLVSCKPGRKKDEKSNHAPLSQFHIGDCNIELASFICL